MIDKDSATAAQRFATARISYAGDPSSMEELADRVGELKAAKSGLDAYLERLKALFVASGRDEAEGVLFRVVLSAESVATTLDRKALEAAMGDDARPQSARGGDGRKLARPVFEIRQAVAQLQLLCADRQGEARGVSRRRFE